MAHQELADPTDWINTELAPLKDIDSLLRCTICKDFYSNAVITTCCHTFCSLCIRRSLDSDGHCPTCRTPEQQPRLRRNVAVQELTDSFQGSRPHMLTVARRTQAEKDTIHTGKRKRQEAEAEEILESSQSERKTRRSTRRPAPRSSQAVQRSEPVLIDDSQDEHDETFQPEPEDGLVPCPMCGKRMKEEQVFPHLDRCETEQKQERVKQQPPAWRRSQQPTTDRPPPEKLPKLNYNLLKDTAFRQKLTELGVPSHGSRQQMQRRHMEWINIWNANCDSAYPKARSDLLRDLDIWERSAGRPAGESRIMQKDFDGAAYAERNKQGFTDLLAQARASIAKVKTKGPEQQQPDDSRATAAEGDDCQVHVKPPLSSSIDPATHFQQESVRSEANLRESHESHRHSTLSADGQRVRQAATDVDESQLASEARRPSDLMSSLAMSGESIEKRPMFVVPQAPVSDMEASSK